MKICFDDYHKHDDDDHDDDYNDDDIDDDNADNDRTDGDWAILPISIKMIITVWITWWQQQVGSGWLIWGSMSHLQLRPCGEGTSA